MADHHQEGNVAGAEANAQAVAQAQQEEQRRQREHQRQQQQRNAAQQPPQQHQQVQQHPPPQPPPLQQINQVLPPAQRQPNQAPLRVVPELPFDRLGVSDGNGSLLFRKGVLDNADNIHAWLGTQSIFGRLIFKTVNVPPFTDLFERDPVLTHGYLICFGRALAAAGNVPPGPVVLKDAKVLYTGEIITPVKPTGVDLPEPQAQVEYLRAVDVLRTATNAMYICGATETGFTTWGGYRPGVA
ncbi:hypothetical protein COOONC_02924 [Cooperia oncophora]